jgi:caa(3)-type oxidase subunit IV
MTDAADAPARPTTAARRIWLPDLLAWAALMGLLALTLGSAYVPMGALNAAVNLGIAGLKAAIVAVVFMGLRRDDALLRLAAGAALFWLLILFALTFSDFLTRPA